MATSLWAERGEIQSRRKISPPRFAMFKKLGTEAGQTVYRRRKVIAEPVFGWVKQVLGFRTFSLRGLEKVEGEWDLVCLALNLKRMNGRLPTC